MLPYAPYTSVKILTRLRISRIQHYAAARELVPLAECSRSFTAVQVVICMAIYLKSVSAQRAMHTHVSIACYAA